MEQLIIDRADHLTGSAFRINAQSGLCRHTDGLMCCLGFYGLKLGLSKHDMHHEMTLRPLDHSGASNWLYKKLDPKDRIAGGDIEVQDALITSNDDFKAHPLRREARIKKLFKKYGDIDVVFVGKRFAATQKAKRALKKVGL